MIFWKTPRSLASRRDYHGTGRTKASQTFTFNACLLQNRVEPSSSIPAPACFPYEKTPITASKKLQVIPDSHTAFISVQWMARAAREMAHSSFDSPNGSRR
jgi:hypothetical protein